MTFKANGLEFSVCSDPSANSDPCLTLFSLEGILEVTKSDVEFAISHPTSQERDNLQSDIIHFPTFELPIMTRQVENILRNELDSGMFADMWKSALQNPDISPLTVGEMIILVPNDKAIKTSLLPSEFNPEILEHVVKDFPVQKHVLSSHLIIREREIPDRIMENLPEYYEIIKVNLAGKNVVFHREDAKGGRSKFKIVNSVHLV